MARFSTFGCVIDYEGTLRWPILPTEDEADLVLRVDPSPCPYKFDTTWFTIFKNGQIQVALGPTSEGILLRLPRLGDFHICRNVIVFHELNKESLERMEPVFFQMVLPVWLEVQGALILHASCVTQINKAVGFLASSHSGKSTLAGAFTQAGFGFLSDDILTLRKNANGFFAFPSYPWLRLLSDSAQFLGFPVPYQPNQAWHKNIIRFGSDFGQYSQTPSHLAVLYLPVRVSPDRPVRIQTLRPAEAFVMVARHSFSRQWTRNSPLEKARMNKLADLVKKVKVCQLDIPDGLENLPAIITIVQAALENNH